MAGLQLAQLVDNLDFFFKLLGCYATLLVGSLKLCEVSEVNFLFSGQKSFTWPSLKLRFKSTSEMVSSVVGVGLV